MNTVYLDPTVLMALTIEEDGLDNKLQRAQTEALFISVAEYRGYKRYTSICTLVETKEFQAVRDEDNARIEPGLTSAAARKRVKALEDKKVTVLPFTDGIETIVKDLTDFLSGIESPFYAYHIATCLAHEIKEFCTWNTKPYQNIVNSKLFTDYCSDKGYFVPEIKEPGDYKFEPSYKTVSVSQTERLSNAILNKLDGDYSKLGELLKNQKLEPWMEQKKEED